MTKQQLTIEHIKIKQLKPAAYNPRKISDKAFADLQESLRRYEMVDPLIVNGSVERKNIIIGGHQRYRAAKELGYETVPVVFVDLDEARERELNLRLNRNTGQWDFELLKDFDIGLLLDVGFDDSDLADIWNDALEIDEDDFDIDKAVKQAAETTIKPGALFSLGKHQLLCGDATDTANVAKLMGSNKADMVYCDPPYNISLDYSKGISTDGKYGGTTNDRKSDHDYDAFINQLIKNSLSVTAADAHVFFWCDQAYIGLLQSLMTQNQLANKRVCLWIKNNFNMTPQVAFNKAYEPCVYATTGKPFLGDSKNLNEILNKDIAPGNRTADDIIDLFDIWLAKREPAQDYQHPTQKPTTLHEKPLKRCTKINDVVLDPTAGSGSTLLACEQMNRVAMLCEIEPIFCQVIIDRWEAFTGQKAVEL
jgi:DNA modification methylase